MSIRDHTPDTLRAAEDRAKENATKAFVVTPRQEYFVPSASDPTDGYKVFKSKEGWRCQCRAWVMGAPTCHHVGAVSLLAASEGWVVERVATADQVVPDPDRTGPYVKPRYGSDSPADQD